MIIVLAAFFGRNLSTSDFSLSPSYLSRKKGTSETFLSLSLFISRPQKSGFGFKKLFLSSLFSTSVTLDKLKSDVDKFFLRVASTIIRTKYYCDFLKKRFCKRRRVYLKNERAMSILDLNLKINHKSIKFRTRFE